MKAYYLEQAVVALKNHKEKSYEIQNRKTIKPTE